MHSRSEHASAARPPSPWSGSRHETQHRWQLDGARSLTDAAEELRALAGELAAAHAAGWWLLEPMRNGHLRAARASRRKRAHAGPVTAPMAEPTAAVALRWRQRVVDELPLPGDEVRHQLLPIGPGRRLWGVAPARVGPSVDLVADGSALRVHALHEGALVRTAESLAFQHAADGAETLLAAAAAYQRLARAADAMVAVGGRLTCVDDGRLDIAYDRR
jgi:hypothetical protein